jgi:hypothetical protein
MNIILKTGTILLSLFAIIKAKDETGKNSVDPSSSDQWLDLLPRNQRRILISYLNVLASPF